jgi:hypothetical protein
LGYIARLFLNNNINNSRCQWLMPVILGTWEAEIRRVTVGSRPMKAKYFGNPQLKGKKLSAVVCT